ncbi:hypothetical protein QVH36_11330, partial [Corynebacterium rouxii]
AACASVAFAGTGVAGANVFHGHWIGGRIEEAYHRLGGWNTFGDATTDERIAKNNGRFQVFAKDASIYWHAGVDNGIAHQVGGRIRNKWGDLGWEGAALGYPITDELKTPDGVGRFNHFQGGSIYWSPDTDAHQVWGGIRDKWGAAGMGNWRPRVPNDGRIAYLRKDRSLQPLPRRVYLLVFGKWNPYHLRTYP